MVTYNCGMMKQVPQTIKKIESGDFIVHSRSFEGGLEKTVTVGIISPAYHTPLHGEGIDPRFYYLYFRSAKFINEDLKTHVYGIRDGAEPLVYDSYL